MNSVSNMSGSRLWAAYLGEMRFEFIKSLRTPAFAVPTLLFPILFYVMFGIFFGSMRGSSDQAVYLFATYGVFGAMGPGLFGFGVSWPSSVSWGCSPSTTCPHRQGPISCAQCGHVVCHPDHADAHDAPCWRMCPALSGPCDPLRQRVTLPFCTIGMFVASLVSGQAAVAICNLIFLPMSFLSGLWFPLRYCRSFWSTSLHMAGLQPVAAGAARRGRASSGALPHVLALVLVTVCSFSSPCVASRAEATGCWARALDGLTRCRCRGLVVALMFQACSVASRPARRSTTTAAAAPLPPTISTPAVWRAVAVMPTLTGSGAASCGFQLGRNQR
jgi:ABC-2 type transport system permease protein